MAGGASQQGMGLAELEREERTEPEAVQMLGKLMSRKHQCRTQWSRPIDELLAECRRVTYLGVGVRGI